MRVLKVSENIEKLSKVKYNDKIGRVIGLTPFVATVAFENGEIETVPKDSLVLTTEDFKEREPVKILVEGEFYDGFVVKRLKDDLYLVIMSGDLMVTPSQLLERVRHNLGFYDSEADLGYAKNEWRSIWVEPY
jgi:hypothetical protein